MQNTDRIAQEEQALLTEISQNEKLARENPERYTGDLARSYNNAAAFYKDQAEPQKAEEYYLKAIALREKLAKANPERYTGDLADSYNAAAAFYKDQAEPQKAEEYSQKANLLKTTPR